MALRLREEDQSLIADAVELLENPAPSDEEFFWQKLFVGLMKLRNEIVHVPPIAKNVRDLSIRRAIDLLKSVTHLDAD